MKGVGFRVSGVGCRVWGHAPLNPHALITLFVPAIRHHDDWAGGGGERLEGPCAVDYRALDWALGFGVA